MKIESIIIIIFAVLYFFLILIYNGNLGDNENSKIETNNSFIFARSFFISFFISLLSIFFIKRGIALSFDGKWSIIFLTLKQICLFYFKLFLINGFVLFLIETFIGVGFFYYFFFVLNIYLFLKNVFWNYKNYYHFPIPISIIKKGLWLVYQICLNMQFHQITYILVFQEYTSWSMLKHLKTTKIPIPKSFHNYLVKAEFTGDTGAIFKNCLSKRVKESIRGITDSFSFDDYNKILSLVEFFNDYFQFYDNLKVKEGVVESGEFHGITLSELKEKYLSYIFGGGEKLEKYLQNKDNFQNPTINFFL